MKIVVRKVPPSTFLEGFDLRSYGFRAGHVYDVSLALADVLIAWDYADPETHRGDRHQANDKKHRE